MVRALLEIASGTTSSEPEAKKDDDDNTESERVVEEDEESDYDSDCDSSSDDVVVRRTAKDKRLNERELRGVLTAQSRQSLHGLNLMQLAVVVDDPRIFVAVCDYAKELTLPVGAAKAWMREVEASEDETIVADTEEKSIELRHRRNTRKSAEMHAYSTRFRDPQPTFLQVAVWFNSLQIAQTIVNGEADDSLLSWLSSPVPKPTPRATHRNDIQCNWLASRLSSGKISRPELVSRLVGVDAVDAVGRNAFFYATHELIPFLAMSAAQIHGGSQLACATTLSRETPLMAACGAAEMDRIRALLSAGFSRSASAGGLQWNAGHMAVVAEVNVRSGARLFPTGRRAATSRAGRNVDRRSPAERAHDKWSARRFILEELLGNGASDEDKKALLLAPGAEHTPLMLAAARGADEDTIRWLTQKTIECAQSALLKRDSNLNSVLHVAVQSALSSSHSVAGELSVRALLDACRGVVAINYATENAKGVTPLDLATEALARVWEKTPSKPYATLGVQVPTSSVGSMSEDVVPISSAARRSLIAMTSESSVPRTRASFDEVKEVSQRRANEADKDDEQRYSVLDKADNATLIGAPSFTSTPSYVRWIYLRG